MSIIMMDLDGTLLRKPGFDISSQNLQMVLKAQSLGFKLGIATGRNISEIDYLLEKHNLKVDYKVALNGMLVENNGLKVNLLSQDQKLDLISYLSSNDIEYEAQTTNNRLFTSKQYVEWLDCAMGAKLEVDSGLNQEISKLVIRQVFNDKPIKQIYHDLILNPKFDSLQFILCNETIIEVINQGINKQSQIERLALGDNVFSIGDSENDVQMLNNATRGYLIASDNQNILKELNSNVTIVDSVADAIKMIIEEFYE